MFPLMQVIDYRGQENVTDTLSVPVRIVKDWCVNIAANQHKTHEVGQRNIANDNRSRGKMIKRKLDLFY